MKQNNLLINNGKGELIYEGLNSHIKKKYCPDTPLDRSVVTYAIMIFCCVVDITIFINLFSLISYDNPFLTAVQVAGFAIAIDILPVYIGMQHKRMTQKLVKEKFSIWFALSIFAVAIILNTVLRILTIDQLSSDAAMAANDYFGNVIQESEEAGTDPAAIAMAVFGIVIPCLTSASSYFISFVTYNPVQNRKRTIEELLGEKKDEIRRLDAILFEYDENIDFGENLIHMDEGKFEEMVKMHRALVVNYCEYVRERLKEHLATPTAINSLSEEHCDAIMERLDRIIAATDKLYDSNNDPISVPEGSGTVITEKTIATGTDVAA